MTQLELVAEPNPGTLKWRVLQCLQQGGWWTDAELCRAVGHDGYMSSVESARRRLRAAGYTIVGRKRSARTSEYRVVT